MLTHSTKSIDISTSNSAVNPTIRFQQPTWNNLDIGGLIPAVEANSMSCGAKSAANPEANRELQGASLPGSHPEISPTGPS